MFYACYRLVGDPYLNQSNCIELDGLDDSKEYLATKRAMEVVGINSDEQVPLCNIPIGESFLFFFLLFSLENFVIPLLRMRYFE